jgi:hypothetical protein
MKNNTLFLLLLALQISLKAQQEEHMPRYISNDYVYDAIDTKTGQRTPRYALRVHYTNGSVERADMRFIKKNIPGARQALFNARSAHWLQIGTTTTGLVCGILTTKYIFDDKIGLSILSGAATIGGFWGTVHFGRKKHAPRDQFLEICNSYFAKQIEMKKKTSFIEILQPTEMRLGGFPNNTIGLGLAWRL